jgi:predicted GIY-YIG superfamily endonuclease
MHPDFASIVESLEPTFRLLMQMKPVRYSTLPKGMPASGIYLFSEGKRHLYVGRSRSIRSRLSHHCTPGATHRRGPFAFHLAREATERTKATYKTEGSRSSLMRDPEFSAAFNHAKARIRKMDIRFVSEVDPLKQALLEMYVAIALQTRYNDFDTH